MFTTFEIPFLLLPVCFLFFFFFSKFLSIVPHINLVISEQFFPNQHFLKKLFIILLFFNITSLIPYFFSFTSTPQVFFFRFIFWLSIFLPLFFYNFHSNIAHFLPQSSPLGLSFFIVVIELVSMLARPLALRVRLIANITAGHLLIHLFCHGIEERVWYLFIFFILLLFLEIAVAFIQAYVFTILTSLYTSESS